MTLAPKHDGSSFMIHVGSTTFCTSSSCCKREEASRWHAYLPNQWRRGLQSNGWQKYGRIGIEREYPTLTRSLLIGSLMYIHTLQPSDAMFPRCCCCCCCWCQRDYSGADSRTSCYGRCSCMKSEVICVTTTENVRCLYWSLP